MKITTSTLVQIIKEEVKKVYEQLPPSDDEIASAFGDSLTTGFEDEEGEWQTYNRSDTAEYDAIVDVLDRIGSDANIGAHLDEMLSNPDVIKHFRLDEAPPEAVEEARQWVEVGIGAVKDVLLDDIDVEAMMQKHGNPSWEDFAHKVRMITTSVKKPSQRSKNIRQRFGYQMMRVAIGELLNQAAQVSGVGPLKQAMGFDFRDIE